MTCTLCGGTVGDPPQLHTFYTWKLTHTCEHTVKYQAVCEAFSFQPGIGQNTSALLLGMSRWPCLWCGGEQGTDWPGRPPIGAVATFGGSIDEYVHPIARIMAERQ